MFENLRHPGFRQLNRYVDGELHERERARVATHLARCDDCRDTVARLRALGAAARELPTPAAPGNLIELALQRRAVGDRVILPHTPPGAPRRRTFALPIAAAAVVVLAVAAVLTLRAPTLQAARGGLTITPAHPAAGARLSFDYEDGGRFQGLQQLAVRARYRTEDGRYQLTAGILDRTADGHFRGVITLPDSVVYAAFAVEDPAGHTVDSNDRRFWDVLVYDSDGRPTLRALMARLNDLITRDWEGAFAVARRMVKLYPDRPAAWSSLELFERSILEDSTVLPRHRQRFAQLEQAILVDDSAAPETLGELAYYAFVIGRVRESRRLIARIDADHAWDRLPLQQRLSLLQIAFPNKDFLARLDTLWSAKGATPRTAMMGYAASLGTGDPDAIWTWYRRQAVADPDPELTIPALLRDLMPIKALRGRVADALEAALRQDLDPGGQHRPLYEPVPAYDRARRREAGRARVALGTLLLDEGRTAEALDQVREGAGAVWTPAILHQAGRILLEHGDTAAAVEAYARMAADPALAPGRRRAIRADLGMLAQSEHWRTAVASARSALTDEIFADRINMSVDTDVVLGDPTGNTVALSRLMSPGATVVVFWSTRCGPAMDAAAAIEQARMRLAANGIRTVVIVTEPRAAELEQALARLRVPFPVYTDRKGQATREFVRFAYSRLDRLVQQAVLLKNSAGTPASVTD
jgi:hypothetical protein